ncbi:protein for resistance to o-dinitrobenzene, calcium, and zinc [Suhomyces tanzawaensis NRRL Y-17324]|uniref:Protein for resistance to o-dinitrobenzene, calcium, and zinc n=1 Tax=Suhomyces tanzawaensis NRRL Y-17324 TaxID=984487 RepID=A0A1E4SLF1_9ASCO|nr:protein for resistance to o-dinitrobenzene, calcium, and zinc [Suhomyces tanzawaensis NRRL Y-17324]ODV80336.1 protein for resistance to o-dinitrobenzene, calcium, and zinc [Suhomyces tanzawaensis NRRL Y-17324]
MFKHHNISLALFDIKLKSPHRDLLLLRGNEFELESVPFEGNVKLSIPEDFHVKRIRLSLLGEYNVEYFSRLSSGGVSDQVFDRLCVLRVDWNNLLTSPDGSIVFGCYGDNFMNYHKMEQMKKTKSRNNSELHLDDMGGSTPPEHAGERPAFLRTNSQPHMGLKHQHQPSKILIPQDGIDGTPFENVHTSSHHSFLLPKGNYNLPFKVFLPANISETVEGLPSASLHYKLHCTIERGRFEKPFVTSKLIRIARTLHPSNLNLTDSIDINNTWPGKVQYNVSIPKKGVPIGSTLPIKILVVPIAKGLTLKGANASIVQHFHVLHSEGKSPEWEILSGKQTLQTPDPESLPVDQWLIKSHFKVPNNLKHINQTCDLKNNIIQVKHRLRITLQLKNQAGHVSELRANVPIHVYISANAGHVIGKHYTLEPKTGYVVQDRNSENILFKKDRKESHSLTTSLNASTDSLNGEEENDLDRQVDAPPLYQQHVYDKIYDLNSPQSPMEQLRIQSAGNSPINSLPGSMMNLDSYFDFPTRNGIESITKIESQDSHLKSTNIDVSALCKVPSYFDAVDDDDEPANQDIPAPIYDDGTSLKGISQSISSLDLSKKRPVARRGFSNGYLFNRSVLANSSARTSEVDLAALGAAHSVASSTESTHKHLHLNLKLKHKKK